jgi:hypothetical protein
MTRAEKQKALFAEHFAPRTDKGLNFTLDDHLKQIKLAERLGISLQEHAKALGVPPIDYLGSLKATLA